MDETGLKDTEASQILALRTLVQSAVLSGLKTGIVKDLAFIGNSSSVYPWVPAPFVDIDIFLFAAAVDRALGSWLLDIRHDLTAEMERRGALFELRIIEGPYKPPIAKLTRPVVLAHLGVFTDETYSASAPLKRWAWRKYRCEVEPSRLARLASARPDLAEVLAGRRGVRERLAALREGRAAMTEWLLPDLQEVPLIVAPPDPNFVECCFAHAASTARNHCRGMGLPEADALGNDAFFDWYDRTVFRSEALGELMRLKSRCRYTGFDVDPVRVLDLAVDYLVHLEQHLSASGSA